MTAPPGVTDPPATDADAAAIIDAACDWGVNDHHGSGRIPGSGHPPNTA